LLAGRHLYECIIWYKIAVAPLGSPPGEPQGFIVKVRLSRANPCNRALVIGRVQNPPWDQGTGPMADASRRPLVAGNGVYLPVKKEGPPCCGTHSGPSYARPSRLGIVKRIARQPAG